MSIISNNKQHKHKKAEADSIIAIIIAIFSILWFIPFLNKGIDYTDAAYNMTLFKNFAAGTAQPSIGTFITEAFGGIIYNLFPSGQYLVFRIVYWLSYIAICVLLYFTFKKVMPKSLLTACIFGGFFMIKHGTTFFAYNSFTSLFLALLIFLLVKAFEKNNRFLIISSGAIVGLSTFIRLPNILQTGFLIAIIWYYGFIKGKKKDAVINSLLFLAGFVIAATIIVAVFVLLYGTDALAASFSSYTSMATDSSGSHGITQMISKFSIQFIAAIYTTTKILLPFLLIVIAGTFAFILVSAKKQKIKFSDYRISKKATSIITIIITLGAIAFAALYVNKTSDYKVFMYIIGMLNLFVGTISAIAFRKSKPEISISAILCACVSVVLAFGSDNIMNTYFTLFAPILIGFVMCFYHLFKDGLFSTESKTKNIINSFVKPFALILVVAFTSISYVVFFFQLFPFTYGPYLNGNGSITKLTATVDNIPELNGMRTSENRAQQFEEFNKVINSEELKNKEIAVFGFFPMAFVISENNNYFNSTWLDLGAVTIEEMDEIYEEKKAEGNIPVIVVSYIYMNDTGNEKMTVENKEKFLDKMLSEYNYTIFYESKNFIVYQP